MVPEMSMVFNGEFLTLYFCKHEKKICFFFQNKEINLTYLADTGKPGYHDNSKIKKKRKSN